MPDIIDDIIKREGDETNDPADSGGRTKFGISEASNPSAWADGDVTREEARGIYETKYIKGPGFDKLSGLLQEFMVDWGVMSGPGFATMKLQEILGAKVDGVLGPDTLKEISKRDSKELVGNLIDARILSYINVATRNPKDLKFLYGWVNRVLGFRRK